MLEFRGKVSYSNINVNIFESMSLCPVTLAVLWCQVTCLAGKCFLINKDGATTCFISFYFGNIAGICVSLESARPAMAHLIVDYHSNSASMRSAGQVLTSQNRRLGRPDPDCPVWD